MEVAISWRRLLIGNSARHGREHPGSIIGRHFLAAPIDWKLGLNPIVTRLSFCRRHFLVAPIN